MMYYFALCDYSVNTILYVVTFLCILCVYAVNVYSRIDLLVSLQTKEKPNLKSLSIALH